jgi:hypothetical protein
LINALLLRFYNFNFQISYKNLMIILPCCKTFSDLKVLKLS